MADNRIVGRAGEICYGILFVCSIVAVTKELINYSGSELSDGGAGEPYLIPR